MDTNEISFTDFIKQLEYKSILYNRSADSSVGQELFNFLKGNCGYDAVWLITLYSKC